MTRVENSWNLYSWIERSKWATKKGDDKTTLNSTIMTFCPPHPPTKLRHFQVSPGDMWQNVHILLNSKSGRPVTMQVKKGGRPNTVAWHPPYWKSGVDFIFYLDVSYRGKTLQYEKNTGSQCDGSKMLQRQNVAVAKRYRDKRSQ
jgi:hypothetical protein